jgi:hypothetical protein
MKFADLVSKFKKGEEPAAAPIKMGVSEAAIPAGEVVLAGRVVTAAKDGCCIDINGAQYDITPGDILDVQLLASAVAGKPDAPVKEITSNDVVLFKMNGNVNLCRRMFIPAALVAAAGTWLSVAPNPQAPETRPEKSAS